MHKKIFAWMMTAAILAVTFAGCGKQTQPAQSTTAPQSTTAADRQAEGDIASPQSTQAQPAQPAQPEPPQQTETPPAAQTTAAASDAQFGPLFQQFVRDKVADGSYTLRTEQSGMRMVMTMSGKDSALESDAAGILHFTLISKGGQYYMLMHNTKKYAQMSAEDYAKQADSLESAALQLDKLRLQSTGEETVGGKTYRTETYDEGDVGTVTYFFDETGARRTRVVKDGKTSIADVFEVSGDADAAAFEIPAGYTLVADPSLLLAQ